MAEQFNPDLDRLAARNAAMPIGLDMADQYTYQSLAILYERFRTGQVSKQEARSEKTELLSQWALVKSRLDFLSRETMSKAAEISEASRRYEQDRTIEAADRMYKAFWGGREPQTYPSDRSDSSVTHGNQQTLPTT